MKINWLESDILLLDEVDSTNTYARQHYHELNDGVLVAARHQTAGRGRLGRSWSAPAGRNLTATYLFKHLQDGFHAGCILGLAALRAVRNAAPAVPAYLKWPNDIYVEERKLAGILCESAEIAAGRVTGVAAGIGINLNLHREELAAIDQPATSLLAENNREINLEFMLRELAKEVKRYYIIYSNNPETILTKWKSANLLLGEQLTVIDAKGTAHRGIFGDISDDGSLLLEENGAVRAFHCGDVKIDRQSVDWNHIKHKVSDFISSTEE